ncbi:PTS sugar transporter subunit IIC [Thermophilibacter provencensis]|uniref:PTS sugar transporter subunit IIC n=1 Tax=Thermophilibacter provencensis TaxID=1852386 RepID=UPI00094AA83F|nr:PTS transporter subunit EIIC [Thermophilibacter provencensis]
MSNRLLASLEKLARSLGNERHLASIRTAFMRAIPLFVINGIATFLRSALVSLEVGGGAGEVIAFVIAALDRAINGSLGIISILLALLIPHSLATRMGYERPIVVSIVSVASFFVAVPPDEMGSLVGTTGITLAIIVSIASAELFMRLAKLRGLAINLGDGVPSEISDSFRIMAATGLTATLFAVVMELVRSLTGYGLNDLLLHVIQEPLAGMTATLPGAVFAIALQNLLFLCGIHPGSVITPVFGPIFLAALDSGQIVNTTFNNAYAQIGGTGCTIGIVLSLLILARRGDHRGLATLSLPLAAFNVNEPIVFGLPCVFNPILAVPFVLTGALNLCVAYFATLLGLVAPMTHYVVWSMPSPLIALIGSGGDWRHLILSATLIALDTLAYLPFVMAHLRAEETGPKTTRE